MQRAVLILTTLFIVAGTLTGVVRVPIDSAAPDTACARHTAMSLTDLRHVEFYRCVDSVFNERFPYRDALRHAKAWVDYYVFHGSQVRDVHVGRNGWLNYRYELRDYQKDACDQAQAMKDLAHSLHELEEVIETSGKRFVFIVAPNKSTIYPEYVGLSRSPTCGKSAYDLLLEALGEYPVKQFLRLDELLLAAKHHNQIYYKTDTHWNEAGALIVARTLLQRLAPDKWHDYLGEVVMTTSPHLGNLAAMMGLHVSEMALSIQTKPWETVSMEERSPKVLDVRHDRMSPVASDRAILPRAVFYRDSFMNAPLGILGGAFAETDSYWIQRGGNIRVPTPGSENVIKLSKIIVLEVWEHHLPELHIDVKAFGDPLRR